MGRTVDELLEGSPAHKPMTSIEVSEWQAVWKLRAYEHEEAVKKSQQD